MVKSTMVHFKNLWYLGIPIENAMELVTREGVTSMSPPAAAAAASE